MSITRITLVTWMSYRQKKKKKNMGILFINCVINFFALYWLSKFKPKKKTSLFIWKKTVLEKYKILRWICIFELCSMLNRLKNYVEIKLNISIWIVFYFKRVTYSLLNNYYYTTNNNVFIINLSIIDNKFPKQFDYNNFIVKIK